MMKSDNDMTWIVKKGPKMAQIGQKTKVFNELEHQIFSEFKKWKNLIKLCVCLFVLVIEIKKFWAMEFI